MNSYRSLVSLSILKTVSYADVFDYPLTMMEIYRWQIRSYFPLETIRKTVSEMKTIVRKDGYVCMKGREKIFGIRKNRKKFTEGKLIKARMTVSLLSKIPTVQFVGLTGALAMENSDSDDDIDLLIISRSGFLWTTRFFVTFLLDRQNLRRKPGDRTYKDKICLNMYMDAKCLTLPREEHDLYSAHEILQMKPLVNKNHTYEQVLSANSWAKNYLPVVWKEKQSTPKVSVDNYEVAPLWKPFEQILKQLQIGYMGKKRTSEVITDTFVRFHPFDARKWIMKKYSSEIPKNLTKR